MSFDLIIKVRITTSDSFILASFFKRSNQNTIFSKPVHIDEFPYVYEELTIEDHHLDIFDSASREEVDWYKKMLDPSVPNLEKDLLETPSSLLPFKNHEIAKDIITATTVILEEESLAVVNAVEIPPSNTTIPG